MHAETIKNFLRPTLSRFRENYYSTQFRRRMLSLSQKFSSRLQRCEYVQAQADKDTISTCLKNELPPTTTIATYSLQKKNGGAEYWNTFSSLYREIGNGREKALEHALTFQLLDFKSVNRYCDVAASSSPIAGPTQSLFPHVEFWRQDCAFKTNVADRTVGGFAQAMTDIPSGYFDAMTLHCSFEHFYGPADSAFVTEVDRVLTERGACIILPLYMDTHHKIFFDPTVVSDQEIDGYDEEAILCAAYQYRQKHGRYYSASTLKSRILDKVPASLCSTLIEFHDQNTVDPSIYLQFGLVLHRKNSVFFLP